MRPTSGLTFGGRYQLTRRIAIGGMGEVWEANDLVIGRSVALKILKDEYTDDPNFLERFRAEARHAARVNHEGIANVYDYGEEENSAYLVMELVPGEALSTILERQKVLSTDQVLDIVAQTASALQAAHSVGLVHRDIKPGNLLITPDHRVKITDFGIARIADQVPLTATGQVMGTVQYISPEQASGQAATASTDIYSLGIVAFEALAGHRPFTGESQVAIAMAQINEPPPELPSTVAEPVQNLVYSCLEKKAENRPASAAHLSRAARAIRRGDIVAAIASVPQVLGDNELESLQQDDDLNTTQVLDQLNARDTRPTVVQSQSPWTWPLIALIGLLAIVLIGTLVAVLMQPNQQPGPDPTTPPPTSSETPTDDPDGPDDPDRPQFITINEVDFVDKDYAIVSSLTSQGFVVQRLNGSIARSPNDLNKIESVSPSGLVPYGSQVFVSVYQRPASPAPPTNGPTLVTPAQDVQPGAVAIISWPAYASCPSGFDLFQYIVTVTGGVLPNGTTTASVAKSEPREIGITVGASSETVTARYQVVCAGDITTNPTPELSVTVVINEEE